MTDEQIIAHIKQLPAASQLFEGKWHFDFDSQSEADYTLCIVIGVLTQDREQLLRVFFESALGKRTKAQNLSYQAMLIKGAIK